MSKYNFQSIRDDYLTPPAIYQQVLQENDLPYFECDTCCSKYNIPALIYYKRDGQYALNKKIGEENGLTGDWFAFNWCNPPFGQCEEFVKKAAEQQQKGKTTFMLIPARPETEYWQKYILQNGKANRANVEVHFYKKGICFIDPDTMQPIKMKVRKNGKEKFVDGVYKNPLALVTFKGVQNV